MSRSDAATQSGNSTTVSVNLDLRDFTDPVTMSLFFNPKSAAPCGHVFESQAIQGFVGKNCPCCRTDIVILSSPPPFLLSALTDALEQNQKLYAEVYFDLNDFKKIFDQQRVVETTAGNREKVIQEAGLKTPVGERYIRLLENAPNHLNEAISLLVSTRAGRDLLRTNAKMRALISPESLVIQVQGKSIREWLDPTAELLIQEQATREAVIAEQTAAFNSFLRPKCRLFSQRHGAQISRTPCEAVNAILQEVVNGQRMKVREMLERLKRENAYILKTVLTSVSTTPIIDYSGKKIENRTILQAAAASGDVSLHPELVASDRNHEGMCEIIQSYFSNNAEGQEDIASQLAGIFPNGIEAHAAKQKRDTFNFDAIIAAISRASTADLDRALSLDGARFDELNDAARAKPTDQLTLTEALNRFREQFTKKSTGEETFNPQHLLKVFELYNAMWEQCERDGTDRDYKKRGLFWRQVIGFAQRFLPACYAQSFAQGLWYLIKVDQDASWRPEVLKNDFEFKHAAGLRFYPLSSSCSGLGFDFAGAVSGMGTVWPAVGGCAIFTKLMSSKNNGLGELMPKRRVQSHSPRA